ncbi:MAG: DivIVA domain-containing protein [Deferrisomatales bacterium]
MRITALDLHEQTFRVRFRGFDPGEVDAVLQRAADELERLAEERNAARKSLEEEQRLRGHLEETLASARVIQEGILERARAEAETLRHQAQLRADRILAEANEELVRLRREAQQLEERRGLWLAELSALGGTLQEWVAAKRAQGTRPTPLIADDPQEGTDPDVAPER